MQSLRRAGLAMVIAVVPLTQIPQHANAADIDTEHIFGFMIGSDIGSVGEREFQSQTTGRFGNAAGRYRFGEQEFELEWVPAENLRIEIGSSLSAHQIHGVPGLTDDRGFAWNGLSVDIRYRLLNRETAPVGMTLAIDGEFSRVDETSGARTRDYGTGLTLAFDRELISGTIAALNLIYQPQWAQRMDVQRLERDSIFGASLGFMTQLRPYLLIGGEARYVRSYEGIGLGELTGQALFVGPTAYFQLSDRSRLTASWSTLAWARSASPAHDPVNFERHQARLTYGINF